MPPRPPSDGGLRKMFREELKVGFHWQPIESALMGGGIPDANYCASGGYEGWVEMKQTKEWAVTLEVDQIGWLVARARRGGRVFIAVRRHCEAGPRKEAADELWLIRGSFAREARALGLRGLPPAALCGRWAGGRRGWDWSAVAGYLRG